MLAASREGLSFHSDEVGLLPPPPYAGARNSLMDKAVVGKTLVASVPKPEDAIPEQAILDQLVRILDSSVFIQSERLGRFLRFTVETTLAGKAGSLKEYLIGTDVYERKPSYHPGEDSIVRSEACRLRRKLKEYYESEGKDDPVLIFYRPGSYVPVFTLRELVSQRPGIRIAVLPFVDASRSILSGECAQFMTDELIHELVRTEGLRVTTTSSVRPLVEQALDIPSLARKLDVQIVFEGTVREDDNQLRISVRVLNADGFHILSERFETKSDLQGVFKVSEKIVSELIRRVGREPFRVDKQRSIATPSMLAVNS